VPEPERRTRHGGNALSRNACAYFAMPVIDCGST
jgi:hypothetical protein